MQKVKTNADDFISVADQCAEVVKIVAEASSGRSLEDADPQLSEDLARLNG